MSEIYGDIKIYTEGPHITYVLGASINSKTNKPYMPYLAFYKDYGYTHEKALEHWDRDDYLYWTLYKQVLIEWVKNKKILLGEDFADVLKIEGVHIEDLDLLKRLFDKSIELGFFNQVIEKENESDNN